MNDTIDETRIDLDRYVEQVRHHLADLDTDVREELTEGLAADLVELVEDQGPGALRRPEEYAAELRAAAGFGPSTRRPLLPPDWWRPGWDVVVAALPAWWVARAWVWVMLLHVAIWGQRGDAYDVPWLPTSSWGLGMLVWAIAAVVSIQLGRGRLWPSVRGTTAAVAAVVAIDVATLAGGVVVWDQMDRSLDYNQETYAENVGRVHEVNRAVITYEGRQSCVLRVFDAHGKRVPGARVVDQDGRSLPMRNRQC